MPKSSSKRKKEKNADFKKTKLKVGGKKVVADSFTDTSFKSRSISLPSQSITHDKSAALTNSRNVTFSELIIQLKHYSPNTRKDALHGLRDLFHRHAHLLPLHLGILLNTVVRLLIDDSPIVRKALQAFLAEFIPTLHPRDVHPFLPLMIVYTCSAMTHIFEDIREDALKFMDIWVAAGGQIVVNGFWDKIIPNYISLLTSDSNATNASKLSSAMSFTAAAPTSGGSTGASGTGSNTKVVTGASTGKNAPGSVKAKSEVLESLAGFLQEGLGGEGGDKDPYWFLRNFLGTEHARRTFNMAKIRIDDVESNRARKRKGSKKRKAPAASQDGGRSKRRAASESESEEDSEDDSSDEDDESTEESDSEESDNEAPVTGSVGLVPDFSPLISFSKAHRHHQLLATVPLHNSLLQSSIVHTLFGDTVQQQNGQRTPNSSIPVRIFHQQGGASASGAGANVGASGSGKASGDGLGGVQGRIADIKPLITTLHPLLLSIWLDIAPSVFGSSSTIHPGHALTTLHLVLRIWGILWRAALARPKVKASEGLDQEQEQEQERQEERWLNEFLQTLLKHVLIYFPFGKDSIGMVDAKVAALLQDMNTTYCELTSLFLLASGIGKMRKVSRTSLEKKAQLKKATVIKMNNNTKTSNRPSNKNLKQQQQQLVVDSSDTSSSSDDYDSEEDEEERLRHQALKDSGMVLEQVKTPKWADQVVDFVVETLGWTKPEESDDEAEAEANNDKKEANQMTTLSSDFKSQHLLALLPTLWALLNCLETRRREWVFEALVEFFDKAHVQSGSKRVILEFLSLVIKLQSHPNYTGTFSILVPGARKSRGAALLLQANTKREDRRKLETSTAKLSAHLSRSLLKLPKLLWDLGTERVETSRAVLDLLAWVSVIAGESRAGTGSASDEEERVKFVKTLQSYMSLFFCVTTRSKEQPSEMRTIYGPFVRLPLSLQKRAIEIVYYSGANQDSGPAHPLRKAVQSCCQGADLSDEIQLYIQETLAIE